MIAPSDLLLFVTVCPPIVFLIRDAAVVDELRDPVLRWIDSLEGRRPLAHRKLKGLFECPFCTGFHVGWLIAVLLHVTGYRPTSRPFGDAVLLGFASASFSLLWCQVKATLSGAIDVVKKYGKEWR